MGSWISEVLVDTGAGQKAPSLVAPFVLQIAAVDANALLHVVVIAEGDIMQAVEGVLRARHELGKHEEEAVHRVVYWPPAVITRSEVRP